MAASKELAKKLYYHPRITRWSKGIGAELPEEYKKFWREWKSTQPSPVHYIPKPGKYEIARDGHSVVPIQNVPLPLRYPKEVDEGIWGGEAVVEGFIKKHQYHRRVKRFWVPQLKKSIVYSEVLNKYMRTIVTDRTLQLIHENYGFDYYLLNTPACDLRSLLALKIKKEILVSLADKTLYPDDPAKREEIYAKYEKYLANYTREELEWYGLSYKEACQKHISIKREMLKPVPLKLKLREELIKYLEQEKLGLKVEASEKSWLSKINPFGGSSSSSSSSSSNSS